MDSLNIYLTVMQEYPELFKNLGEPGEIKIIHDPKRIRAEKERIQAELRAQGKPEYWIEIGVLSEDQWTWVGA